MVYKIRNKGFTSTFTWLRFLKFLKLFYFASVCSCYIYIFLVLLLFSGMCSSTSRGVHPPSFQSQLISFHLGDISVNTNPFSSARDKEKGTKWLQWEGENSILTDSWKDSYVLPKGWIIKILLSWEWLIDWLNFLGPKRLYAHYYMTIQL